MKDKEKRRKRDNKRRLKRLAKSMELNPLGVNHLIPFYGPLPDAQFKDWDEAIDPFINRTLKR